MVEIDMVPKHMIVQDYYIHHHHYYHRYQRVRMIMIDDQFPNHFLVIEYLYQTMVMIVHVWWWLHPIDVFVVLHVAVDDVDDGHCPHNDQLVMILIQFDKLVINVAVAAVVVDDDDVDYVVNVIEVQTNVADKATMR